MSQSNITAAGKPAAAALPLAAAAFAAFVAAYYDIFPKLLEFWDRPDYSHAYIVPMIMAWIFWTDRRKLAATAGGGHGLGYLFLGLTAFFFLLGRLSAIMALVFFSIWTLVMAIICLTYGKNGFKTLWAFALAGLFAVPWPAFIFRTLSFQLRLISSALAELMLRMTFIPVFREGNVIDLGTIQLEVVDACSGLRYLLPSILMAVLAGWIFLRRPLLRAILIFAAVPVAVFSNAFRIMVTGILCRWFGPAMAEGFFHDFSGWLVYIISLLALLGILYALRRKDRPAPAPKPDEEPVIPLGRIRPGTKGLAASLTVLLLLTACAVWARQTAPTPARESLAAFPLRLGDWQGRPIQLKPEEMAGLGATEAFSALYINEKTRDTLYFLITYYAAQDSAASAHAPASCLLGSGWSIMAKGESERGAEKQPVGRMLLKKEDQFILSNFWFEQRGRKISNEFRNKLMLFQDAVTTRRTDGGLVRIEYIMPRGVSEDAAQKVVDGFISGIRPEVKRFIPGGLENN